MRRSLPRAAQAPRLVHVHAVIPVPGAALHFQAVALGRLVSRADPRQPTVTRHSGRSREARHQRGVGIPPRRIRLVHAGPAGSAGLKAHVARPRSASVDVVKAGGDVPPIDHFDSLLGAAKFVRGPLDERIGRATAADRDAAGHGDDHQRANPRAPHLPEGRHAVILTGARRPARDGGYFAESAEPRGNGCLTSSGRASRRRRRMFMIRYPTITTFRTNRTTRPTRRW